MTMADSVGDNMAVGIAVGRSIGKVVGCPSDAIGGVVGTSLGSIIGAVLGDDCFVGISERCAASVGLAGDEVLHPLSTRHIITSERILTIIFFSSRCVVPLLLGRKGFALSRKSTTRGNVK